MTEHRKKQIWEACAAAESGKSIGLDGRVTLPANEVYGLLEDAKQPDMEPDIDKAPDSRRVRFMKHIPASKVNAPQVMLLLEDGTINSYNLETEEWNTISRDEQGGN